MRRLILILLGVLAVPALAQVPSAEQLEMLRNLTPEQRQMLLEQMGLGADTKPRQDKEKKPAEDASAEKGAKLFEHVVTELIDLVQWLQTRPIRPRRDHHLEPRSEPMPFGF